MNNETIIQEYANKILELQVKMRAGVVKPMDAITEFMTIHSAYYAARYHDLIESLVVNLALTIVQDTTACVEYGYGPVRQMIVDDLAAAFVGKQKKTANGKAEIISDNLKEILQEKLKAV